MSSREFKKYCECCKMVFSPKRRITKTQWSQQKFCSKICMGREVKGKMPKNLKMLLGLPRTKEWKENISKALTGRNLSPEHVVKMTGENSIHWKKDRNEVQMDRRNDVYYKKWRLKVYRRDDFKCKIANPDCAGRIEAHHILGWAEYVELRYEVNNGITLCHAHHPRKRAEEKRLSPYFQDLVSVSK